MGDFMSPHFGTTRCVFGCALFFSQECLKECRFAACQACPPSSMHRVRCHRPASALPSAQGPSLSTPVRELPGAGDPAGARLPRRSAPTSRPPSARRGVKRSERLRGRVPDHVALPALFGCPQRLPGPLRGNAGLGRLPPLPATPPRGRSTSRDRRAVA